MIKGSNGLRMTYIGGPTALIDWGGLRLLTDPTFDPAGSEYPLGAYALHKTLGPAISPDCLGRVDVVLLSHDHHLDNLDRSGMDFLKGVGNTLSTPASVDRLGSPVAGISPGQSIDVGASEGRVLRVIGAPARHGPEGRDRGPVTGFILFFLDSPQHVVYVSGDTVWHDAIAEVAKCYPVRVAILFMGAAKVAEVGPWHLTFTAEEGIKAATAFPDAIIVPLHYEGWTHYSESREDIARAFHRAGLDARLRWLNPGVATTIAKW